jgi:hypothetical protein
VLADQMFRALVERFGLDASAGARAAFEAAVIASDAVAAHAFVLDPHGSQGYLDLGSQATRALLVPHFGAVAH